MANVLFVCSKNRWRSPTAEHIFADYPGVLCLSAGVSVDADHRLERDMLDWADIVFVMERQHRKKIDALHPGALHGKKVVCLNIPDNYQYMDSALVKLLNHSVSPHLQKLANSYAQPW